MKVPLLHQEAELQMWVIVDRSIVLVMKNARAFKAFKNATVCLKVSEL